MAELVLGVEEMGELEYPLPVVVGPGETRLPEGYVASSFGEPRCGCWRRWR